MPKPRTIERIALAVYWPALALATHWPDLRLPAPRSITDLDKLIHAAAYALLTWLIIRAIHHPNKARSRAIAATLIAVAYAAIDEHTQRYVQRIPSTADFAANLFGVTTVALAHWNKLTYHERQTTSRWATAARIMLALAIPACLIAAFIPIHYIKTPIRSSPLLSPIFYPGVDKPIHLIAAAILLWLLLAAKPLGRRRPLGNTLIPIALLAAAGPFFELLQAQVGRNASHLDLAYHEMGLSIALAAALAFVVIRDTLLRSLCSRVTTNP